MLWPLLSPVHGWVAMTFFFHKILRWTCPFFLIGSLAANAVLLGSPLYDWLFAGQVAFYAFALAGNWIPARPRWLRYLRLPTLFTSMNIALFFGFFRWLFGKNTGVWKRTDRTAPDPIAAEPDLQPAGSVS
jgi:hypothetical protein